MIKRIFSKSLLLATLAMMLIAVPVLAYTYRASYTIINSGNISYDMLATMEWANNDWMAANGFMLPSALDTRIETLGGLIKPHMVADNRTLTAVPVPASSQTNLYFTTGNTLLDSMHIIPGHSDNIVASWIDIADNATIELGANFTVEQTGWVDTTANSSVLWSKPSGITSWVSNPGEITTSFADSDYLSYDGVGDYCHKAAGVVSPSGTQVSIDAWFYVDAPGGAGQIIISDGDAGGVAGSYWYITMTATDKIEFRLGDGAGGWTSIGVSDDAISLDHWHFITYTYSNISTPRTTIYLDGEPIGINDTGIGGNIVEPNVRLAIGARWTGAAYAGLMVGDIDEVRVSDIARSEEDHLKGFAGIPLLADTDTISLWHFNEGTGNPVDEAGNNDLVRSNATWSVNGRTTLESSTANVTATGIASGHYTITTEAAPLLWALGTVLDFNGAINSDINCGAINNNIPKFWISFWWRFDVTYDGSTVDEWVWSKRIGAADFSNLKFDAPSGQLLWQRNGAGAFLLASTTHSWTGGQWYHILASQSDTAGGVQRLLIDNVLEDSDVAAAGNLPNGGNFVIGDRSAGAGLGPTGTVANVVVGIDDLTVTEERELYAGTAPADATDLWYIDEGTGTNIVSYGTVANAGTAGVPPAAWDYDTRPCKFTISVDTPQDGFARPIDVPDNDHIWLVDVANSLPYCDNMTIEVDGVEQLWFDPNTMIIGTVLPDRQGTPQDGTFHWGDNAASVNVTLGGMVSVSQPGIGVGVEEAAQDIMPDIDTSDWFIEPDVAGVLLTNPLRPLVTMLSDHSTLTELQVWRYYGLIFVLMMAVGSLKALRGHLGIASIVTGAAIGLLTALSIWPFWALVFAVGCFIGGLIAERTPSY